MQPSNQPGPAAQRCKHEWEDLPDVVWAEYDQVCPKCGAERDLNKPTPLARLARDSTIADGDPLHATSADVDAMFRRESTIRELVSDIIGDNDAPVAEFGGLSGREMLGGKR